MPESGPLEAVALTLCDTCKSEVAGEGECPNCRGTKLTRVTIYKRLRRERIAFMIGAAVLVSLITFAATQMVTGRAEPQALIAGLFVFSLYAGGTFFLGLTFTDVYREGEVPAEARLDFSTTFLLQEVKVFLGVLVGVVLIAVVFALLGITPGSRAPG